MTFAGTYSNTVAWMPPSLDGVQKALEELAALPKLPEIKVRPELPFTNRFGEVCHCFKFMADDYSKPPTWVPGEIPTWPKKEVWLVSQWAWDRANDLYRYAAWRVASVERRAV